MKKTLFLFVLLLVLGSWPVLAQPGDPSSDPDVPVSGIEILLVAGGLLGVRKYLQSKKKPD